MARSSPLSNILSHTTGRIMNVESANTLALPGILSKLGFEPVKTEGFDSWYLSPLTPFQVLSFCCNSLSNRWKDLESGLEGSVIDFICLYLKSREENHAVADALRFLRNLYAEKLKNLIVKDFSEHDSVYEVQTVMPIYHTLLVEYLHKRGFSLPLVQHYLKQVQVRNRKSGKPFYALGIRNEDGGYAIRNEYIKANIAPKTITFIRGTKHHIRRIHIFKDVFDFLSVLAYQKRKAFADDVIILNSYLSMQDAGAYIRNFGYEYVYTWFGNDAAGKQAIDNITEFLQQERNTQHKPMHKLYAPHKDVNAFLMHRFGLLVKGD